MSLGQLISEVRLIIENDPFKSPDPKDVEKRKAALGDWVVTSFQVDWKEDFYEPLFAIVVDDMVMKVGGDKFTTEVNNDINDSRILIISSKKMTQTQAQTLFDEAPEALTDGYYYGKSYKDILGKMMTVQNEEFGMDEAQDPFKGISKAQWFSRQLGVTGIIKKLNYFLKAGYKWGDGWKKVPLEKRKAFTIEIKEIFVGLGYEYSIDRYGSVQATKVIDDPQFKAKLEEWFIHPMTITGTNIPAPSAKAMAEALGSAKTFTLDRINIVEGESGSVLESADPFRRVSIREAIDPFKGPGRGDVVDRRREAFNRMKNTFKPGMRMRINVADYGGDKEEWMYGTVISVKDNSIPSFISGGENLGPYPNNTKVVAKMEKEDGSTTIYNNLTPETIELVNEAADPFQGADPEDIQSRKDAAVKAQRSNMFAKAEIVMPGIVDKLKTQYNNDDLVETAIAYADSFDSGTRNYNMRNLNWDGFWADGETFIKQCEIVDAYNDFGPEIAETLVRNFPDKEFRLARESSPAVYIRPFTEKDLPYQYDAGQDEMNIEDNQLRLWYD